MIGSHYILNFIKSIETKYKTGSNILPEVEALHTLIDNYFDEMDKQFSISWKKVITEYPTRVVSNDDCLIMPDDVFNELISKESVPDIFYVEDNKDKTNYQAIEFPN
jgi:hypothetical protein